jgi:hypothetical protein
VLNLTPRQRFDTQARHDLDTLLEQTVVDGHQIAWAWIVPMTDGTVGSESDFAFDGEWPLTYVYAPGEARTVPTKEDSSCAEPVNDDWYRSWGC